MQLLKSHLHVNSSHGIPRATASNVHAACMHDLLYLPSMFMQAACTILYVLLGIPNIWDLA
jgi:hypothetical protein